MTGEAVADDKPCPHTTVLRFKLDAMHATIEHLKLKVSEASEAAMRGMKAAMKAVGMNDPDRGPGDYINEDDERVMIPVRMFEQMMRRSGGHGHGSVSSNSRILTVLVAINTALLIGVGGWLLVTVAQHDKDIAVIKCQIDPQCREALARVRP